MIEFDHANHFAAVFIAAILVIACPCALVIATPVSIVSGLTALARRGVLVKGGIYLEAVGKLRALAVDKTGTITQGKPKVVGITPVGDLSEEEILRRAAAINISGHQSRFPDPCVRRHRRTLAGHPCGHRCDSAGDFEFPTAARS